MVFVTLPHTDLRVSSLCLGTGEFGSKVNQADAFRLLDAFVDAGGNFIDTANVYGDWIPGTKSSSEKVIGSWLRLSGNRSRVVLATKGAHPHLARMQQPRLARRDILHDLEESLRHLQTDVIDLYWLHRDDPARPVNEIIDTLEEQVKAGKIRAYGCSNWQTARLAAAQDYAASRRSVGFVGNQMLWNLAVLNPQAIPDPTTVAMDGEMLAYHQITGLAAIPYSAQAHGALHKILAGRRDDLRPHDLAMYPLAANQARVAQAEQLADELDVSFSAIVLGYLHSQPFVTVPIIGCRSLAQLQDSIASSNLRLTPAQLALLEAAGTTVQPLVRYD